jgi:hypothetical protein
MKIKTDKIKTIESKENNEKNNSGSFGNLIFTSKDTQLQHESRKLIVRERITLGDNPIMWDMSGGLLGI